jgi:hypothetical protein
LKGEMEREREREYVVSIFKTFFTSHCGMRSDVMGPRKNISFIIS